MEKMKDSGIRLIGVIPSDWNLKKIKYVCFENSNSLPENTSPDFEFDYIDIGSVKFGKGITDYQRMQFSKAPSRARRIVKKGDVIISTVRTYLKSVASIDEVKTPIIVSTGFSVLTPKENIDKNYLKFAVMCDSFTSEVEAFSTGITYPAINSSSLINLKIPLPPIDIQKRIADFLDSKCAKIDSLKNDIEKQIETLEQYKKSVITETVTKGINPNVKMKDSGIEWIGEIPEHWETKRAKYIFTPRNDRGNKIELQLLSPTQKYGVIPQALYDEISGMNSVKLKENTDLNLLKTCHKGDYCISLRSFQGGFEYSKYEGVVSPAYQIFYPTIKISDGYYKYLFKEKNFIEKINSFTLSLRDGKPISYFDFSNMYLPLPSAEEQKEIADYLDSKCTAIDNIINSKKQQLEKLEEYKKSLIFEYVTGKREV